MGLVFKGRKEIEEYISTNGQLDLKAVSLSSLVHLLRMEHLSIKEIAELFNVDVEEVKDLLKRNGILF